MSEVDPSEFERKRRLYEECGDSMAALLRTLFVADELTVHSVVARVKSAESLKSKLTAKGTRYQTLDDITDLLGLRVITYYRDEVDLIAKTIDREFVRDAENSVDKRAGKEADRFGYESLHYIVQLGQQRSDLPEYNQYRGIKFEIQIRSILQHAWAEIEHDFGYKSPIAVPYEIKRKLYRLSGLLELADEQFIEIRLRSEERRNQVANALAENAIEGIAIDIESLRVYCRHSDVLWRIVDVLYHDDDEPRASTEPPDDFLNECVGWLVDLGITHISELDAVLKHSESEVSGLLYNVMTDRTGLYTRPSGSEFTVHTGLGLFYYWIYRIALMPGATHEQTVITAGFEDWNFGAILELLDDLRNQVR